MILAMVAKKNKNYFVKCVIEYFLLATLKTMFIPVVINLNLRKEARSFYSIRKGRLKCSLKEYKSKNKNKTLKNFIVKMMGEDMIMIQTEIK